MRGNIYMDLLIMAGVTYLVRVLPLTLIRREIQNVFLRSFLYYVPYVTLAVMTFPAILSSTGSVWSAAAALVAAIFLAWRGAGLVWVAGGACAVVLALEAFLC
jgi:branched-subunit amino acid transport protein